MTADAENAEQIIRKAAANGLVDDDNSPLSSPPEQFEATFRELDERVARGDEIAACWFLTARYRLSTVSNEIADPAVTFANHDCERFVSVLDTIGDSRLLYELAFFPLLRADSERSCRWVVAASSKVMVALGIVSALRNMVGAGDDGAELISAQLDALAKALRTKQRAERSRLWWQIAAIASVLGPIESWNELSKAVWQKAGAEIEPDTSLVPEYVGNSEHWIAHCPALRGLLVTIARYGDEVFRATAASALLSDFEVRLRAERWSLPRLREQIEALEYVPAVGWAIAYESKRELDGSWWQCALASRLPTIPQWERDSDNDERCALILFATCHAVELLLSKGEESAIPLGRSVLALCAEYVPRWMWRYPSHDSAIRTLPMTLIELEFLLFKQAADQRRIALFAREIRDQRAIWLFFAQLQRSHALDGAIRQLFQDLYEERSEYEKRLCPSRA